jgi:hypothetical protein
MVEEQDLHTCTPPPVSYSGNLDKMDSTLYGIPSATAVVPKFEGVELQWPDSEKVLILGDVAAKGKAKQMVELIEKPLYNIAL